MRQLKLLMILATASLLFVTVQAGVVERQPLAGQIQVQSDGQKPIYMITVNVVERKATAINYRHRGGSTKIDFRGTTLMPAARGEAKVESKQGYIEIEVEYDNLQSATRFGAEYLTYVMWAITPEGRATNLGEIILNGTKSKLNVTTELQAFGLIVTAEPYFAVVQPSDVVVMENHIRKDTVGKVEEIDAKYELLQRGQYIANVKPADLRQMTFDKKTPLDLLEARNAVRIAKWTGADVSAAETFQKAGKLLEQAENYKARKSGSKNISMAAREAVQTAEDSRLITLKRQEEERLAQERAASAEREALANAATNRAVTEANDALRSRDRAEQEQKLESERRARAEADSTAAKAQTERTKMEAELATMRSEWEKETALARSEREKESALARSERERAAALAQSNLDKEAALAQSNREKETALAQSEQARLAAAERAEQEKRVMRRNLVEQLNRILDTRDSARGLIVNMSDVLFDTGKYTLRPAAREKLAKLSGIIQGHTSLKLEVEGHTDNVGSNESNMRLSENRANSVRDFLIRQGTNTLSIIARGLGENQPVSTNDTAAGRQHNRRVELVVSGDEIGTPVIVTSRE